MQTGKSDLVPIVFVDEPGGSYWSDWDEYVQTHLRARGLINATDLSLYKVTDDVDVAVRELQRFYANYDSSRYVRDLLVIRVRRAPDGRELARLNADFKDLLAEGSIVTGAALPEEHGEAASLPRVLLHFHRRDFGRLRQLIDRLNELAPASAPPPATAAGPHQIVPVDPPAERAES
jgi:hypothetical protein